MSERQGIEIDYCPQCRGVWLDRGELDKLIDKSSATAGPVADFESPRRAPSPSGYYEQSHGGYRHPKKKRKGMLAELFDFD
jgi:Zn-finger nucleic acid-binding protein